MTLDLPASSTSKSARETAFAWLQDAVTTLPWDQESFLNEAEIAIASGTSRTPVREALLRLEAAGLVRRVPNKGAYVPALSESDIERMMEARLVIEEWAVAKAARRRLDLRSLRSQLEEQRRHADDTVTFIQDDVAFHLQIVRAGSNPSLESTYRSLRHQQLRLGVKAVRNSEGRIARVLEEHEAMLDAISTGEEATAVAAVRLHLSKTLDELRDSGEPS